VVVFVIYIDNIIYSVMEASNMGDSRSDSLKQIKASRRGSREAELESEKGWKAVNKIFKNKKKYNRKIKHKKHERRKI